MIVYSNLSQKVRNLQIALVSYFCSFVTGQSDFNFSGFTWPDVNQFDPYPDPPIRNNPQSSAEIEKLLKEYKIIPDVLSKSPKYTINVTYADLSKFNANKAVVEFGTVLKMLDFDLDPINVTWPFSSGFYYTLILTDPDYPTPDKPFQREFHHWLVGNIYENDWKHGDVITEYIGAIPPKKEGTHRFVFVVFEQPTGQIHFNEPSVYDIPPRRKRGGFDTLKFAKKYNLGDPHAVNFFQVKFQDWIPTIRNWTTPFFAILSSEFTTVYQNTPATKKPILAKPTKKSKVPKDFVSNKDGS